MATRKSTTSKSRIKRNAQTESESAPAYSAPANGAAVKNFNGGTKMLPSADQIRFRAYEIFLARGGNHGDDWKDWFAAERELGGPLKSS
jgi:hypothetical protein